MALCHWSRVPSCPCPGQSPTNFIVSCHGARRRSPPSSPSAPPPRAAPQCPWSSRCRSNRVRCPGPNRCVRLRSRHAARGSGHTTQDSHVSPPPEDCRLQTTTTTHERQAHTAHNRSTDKPILHWACLIYGRGKGPSRPGDGREAALTGTNPLQIPPAKHTSQYFGLWNTRASQTARTPDRLPDSRQSHTPPTPTPTAPLANATDPRHTHSRHARVRSRRRQLVGRL